jgi:Fe-S cluster biogenesis protein NfuA
MMGAFRMYHIFFSLCFFYIQLLTTNSFQPRSSAKCQRLNSIETRPPASNHQLFATFSNSDSAAERDISNSVAASAVKSTPAPPAPVLDGKRVLPYKIMIAGLKGQIKVAAVYALYSASYKRGSDGWDTTTFVGVTQNLEETVRSLHENDATELKVAHCRALSFSIPQPNAMQEIASQWRAQAVQAGANLETEWANDVLNYIFDQEDDDDDEDDDFAADMEMMGEAMGAVSSAKAIVSPFASGSEDQSTATKPNGGSEEALAFTAANVDRVLNEVRPYLIADGGNVSVERVDEANQNVYLKLEGACGSCPSSTVTMQMGIERVLREKFPTLKEVLRSDEDSEAQPKELSYQAVEEEINRLKPAIMAMGGSIQLLKVDGENGIVDIQFRGSKKVQQGVELAILDVSFVKEVNFLDPDE